MITIIIVNYNTPDLLKRAVESLPRDIPLIVVENSELVLQPWVPHQRTVVPPRKMFHGDGLHFGISHIMTPYFVAMDSDAYVKDQKIFEIMRNSFTPTSYGVGTVMHVDKNGIDDWHEASKPPYTPYLHPYFCMIDMKKYYECEPYVHHGAPAIYAMMDADKKGYTMEHIDLAPYVHHDGRGTRNITQEYKKGWK